MYLIAELGVDMRVSALNDNRSLVGGALQEKHTQRLGPGPGVGGLRARRRPHYRRLKSEKVQQAFRGGQAHAHAHAGSQAPH
jgi:hypothetical protein